MKKILFFLFFPFLLNAQVGINTTTPNTSSMLDITATDKGLLIPRISIPNLAAAAPVVTPATSLLVYNTNATTGIGFYYWNGTLWTPFTGGSGWSLTGNAGTTPGTNFLGTTGAQDLIIKTNNTEAIRVLNGGNVGIGTTAPTTKLHIENPASGSLPFLDGFEDNTIPPFLTSGTGGNWVTTNAAGEFNAGSFGAKSGTGISSGVSTLDLVVSTPTGGSAFSFNYRVDSESGYDFLRFYVDGIQQGASWSGAVTWATYSGTLLAGNHTLTWKYSKDNSGNTGLDRAFIDQVSIANTIVPNPVVRIVDGAQAAGKVLTSDASGNASWQSITNSSISDIPTMASLQGLIIPICRDISSGSTGSFSITVKGVPTTVSWNVLSKRTKSGSTLVSGQQVANAEVQSERLQVRYDFSPQLPFNPQGIIFSANNNSGFPDVFVLNYATKSQTSITVNISRADVFAEQSGASCWSGQFYYDVFMTN
jgi:hypothetical protein